MKAFRLMVVAAVSLGAFSLRGQVPTPKITDRTPVPLVPPTAAPGGPREYHPRTKDAVPTATPFPTRTTTPTPTPTPRPPLVRLFDLRPGEIAIRPDHASASCRVKTDLSNPDQPEMNLHCDLLPPGGLRADVDLWKGVTLKNGWKVKELNARWTGASNPQPPNSQTGFRVSKTPAPGATDPSTTVHLFASPGGTIDVLVELLVEGPQGTTPR